MKKTVLLLLSLYAYVNIYAQAGTLNTAFDNDGILYTSLERAEEKARDILPETDSRYFLLLIEVNGKTMLSRMNASGNLERSSYGKNGFSEIVMMRNPRAARQIDGSVIVAGVVVNNGKLAFGVSRIKTDGLVDKTFGTAGMAVISFGSIRDELQAIAVTPDGKIVLSGFSVKNTSGGKDLDQDVALARLNSNGTLDNTFSGDGKHTTSVSTTGTITLDYAPGLTIQPDGKMVVAGYSYVDNITSAFVLRYTTGGQPDNTFSNDGKDGFPWGERQGSYTAFNAVTLQPDGKIVTAGIINFESKLTFVVARYNADGTPHRTHPYSNAAYQTITFPATSTSNTNYYAYSVFVRPNGKILVTGRGTNNSFAFAEVNAPQSNFSFANGYTSNTTELSPDIINMYPTTSALLPNGNLVIGGYFNYANNDMDMAIAMYNSNGSINTNFSNNGILMGSLAGHTFLRAVAVQKDGKIVVAGSVYDYPNQSKNLIIYSDFVVARYNANGTIDESFGQKGNIITDFFNTTDEAYDIAIQEDGKIVAVGYVGFGNYDNNHFAVARYHIDGSLDKSFGEGGKVVTKFTAFNMEWGYVASSAHSVTIQKDGKIVVGGQYEGEFAVVCYLPNGALDPTFDHDGKITTELSGFGAPETGIKDIVVQEDGKIVAVGRSWYIDWYQEFTITRYLPNGSLDPGFGDNGVITNIAYPNSYSGAHAVGIQTDGKIVVGGYSHNYDDYPQEDYEYYALVRLTKDGTADATFNDDGIVYDKFSPWNGTYHSSEREIIYDLAIQDDGKIIVAGATNANHFALARYNTDGTLDASFGNNGNIVTEIGYKGIQAIALSGNQLYAVGYSLDERYNNEMGQGIIASYQLGNTSNQRSGIVSNQVARLRSVQQPLLAEQTTIKAMPNPSTHAFRLQLNSNKNELVNIKVFNATGNLVEDKRRVAPNKIITLGEHYQPGIYYVEIYQGNSKQVLRLVKQ